MVANVDCLFKFQTFSKFTVHATKLVGPSAKKCWSCENTRCGFCSKCNLLTSTHLKGLWFDSSERTTQHIVLLVDITRSQIRSWIRRPWIQGREGRGLKAVKAITDEWPMNGRRKPVSDQRQPEVASKLPTSDRALAMSVS